LPGVLWIGWAGILDVTRFCEQATVCRALVCNGQCAEHECEEHAGMFMLHPFHGLYSMGGKRKGWQIKPAAAAGAAAAAAASVATRAWAVVNY